MKSVPMQVEVGKPERFFAIIDPSDGTLWCVGVSAEYDEPPAFTHESVEIFTSEQDAARAAAHANEAYDETLTFCEITIHRVQA